MRLRARGCTEYEREHSSFPELRDGLSARTLRIVSSPLFSSEFELVVPIRLDKWTGAVDLSDRSAKIAPHWTCKIGPSWPLGRARRGGRVVEGARLESVYTGNRIAGSNPALSAMNYYK